MQGSADPLSMEFLWRLTRARSWPGVEPSRWRGSPVVSQIALHARKGDGLVERRMKSQDDRERLKESFRGSPQPGSSGRFRAVSWLPSVYIAGESRGPNGRQRRHTPGLAQGFSCAVARAREACRRERGFYNRGRPGDVAGFDGCDRLSRAIFAAPSRARSGGTITESAGLDGRNRRSRSVKRA